MPESSNVKKRTIASSREWWSLEPELSPWILDAMADMGFAKMTPVQASTIPLFMGYKDVVVEAVTGSGKTLSFLIPIVERILRLDVPTKKFHVASIVIAPTRELAIQIEGVLKNLILFHPPSAAGLRAAKDGQSEPSIDDANFASSPKIFPQLLVSGSNPPAEDLQCFLEYSPNVLVATPGRLLELLSSPRVHCPQSSFEVLVLDEADRLLDLGFKDEIQKILGYLPKQRRTGLFSASVSEALDQLIRVGLRNPVRVAVRVKSISGLQEQKTPASLQMSYVIANSIAKLPILFKILTSFESIPLKTVVYMSTCAGVDYFQHVLSPLFAQHKTPFTLVSLHGKQTPQVRQKNFARFTEGISPSVLLTTDVAARGLDIPQVDLVVQVDPPLDPKVFLHRCGRAGRAGRKGIAVVFLHPHEEDYIPFLDVRKTPITKLASRGIGSDETENLRFSQRIREIVQADRALHEKAQRGFVSWVQAYRKHQARSIFKLSDIDWTDLANAWGLLKMPKMPELKGWDGDVGLGLNVDFDTYGFRNKEREKQRQLVKSQRLERNATPDTVQRTGGTRSWSGKLDQKDGKEKRRAKKLAKREREKQQRMTPAEREEKEELERLIQSAKRQRLELDGADVFEGFSD